LLFGWVPGLDKVALAMASHLEKRAAAEAAFEAHAAAAAQDQAALMAACQLLGKEDRAELVKAHEDQLGVRRPPTPQGTNSALCFSGHASPHSAALASPIPSVARLQVATAERTLLLAAMNAAERNTANERAAAVRTDSKTYFRRRRR
jgi:hypothetical protein